MTPPDASDGQAPRRLSIREAVEEVQKPLRKARIDEAASLAEWVVAEATGQGRAAVRAGVGGPLDANAVARMTAMTLRLTTGEPLPYVIGWMPFRSAVLSVDPRVLIPRPETEQMVGEVLRTAAPPGWAGDALDIGTGSGCIAIALALERPEARVLATDVDRGALAVAAKNVRLHRVEDRVRLELADLAGSAAPGSLDLVISNPPYVATSEMPSLPRSVREWEPAGALDGGPDGLRELRRVTLTARRVLRPGGWLWMEIGEGQGPAVARLLDSAGFAAAGVRPDVAGLDRFAWARQP